MELINKQNVLELYNSFSQNTIYTDTNKFKFAKFAKLYCNKFLQKEYKEMSKKEIAKLQTYIASINESKKPTFIEVCSGAGGLSLGFIKSGFKSLLLNDNNKYCIETLKLNHKKTNIIHKSMVDLNVDKYKGQTDVLMGGVPCQAFSLAGKKKGINDERGKLILTFIKMVNNIEPKVFLIENVKGLLYHNNGETLKLVIEQLKESGLYNIQYKVLNANDYNVPQKRERLIIVGTHKTRISKKFKFPKECKYKPVLKDVLTNCPKSEGMEYSELKKELYKHIPQDGCWINLPENLQKSYLGKSYYSGGGKRGILKRLSMDKPSLTLLTTPSQKQTERCHPTSIRPLQTLEYARIQTFPDNYKFYGSKNQIYKQIGNAVPVNLAIAIAGEIMKVLDI